MKSSASEPGLNVIPNLSIVRKFYLPTVSFSFVIFGIDVLSWSQGL